MESRSVSIFVLDSWADSIGNAISEVLDRQAQSREVIMDNNASHMKESLSADLLMSRISDFQEKLLESEKKNKLLENENKNLGK